MNKDKYISIQVYENEYFLVDIMDFDYNVALNLCKNYWHSYQINQDTTRMEQLEGYNIYSIFSPIELFIFNKQDKSMPNYKIIRYLNEEHFNKFFKFWETNYYAGCEDKIENLKQNYKKYMEEAMIKDIIE